MEARRVLLVDDDVRTSQRLARMLRDDGFIVEVAADGSDAIARLSKDPLPDVVVTEVNLPRASGLAVARYARSRGMQGAVFVTGYPQSVERGLGVVFTKPLEYDALAEHLRRTM